ncbi:FecR family protein, partial [Escherichia coli]|nr:FecR family protein [Escherichia coli]
TPLTDSRLRLEAGRLVPSGVAQGSRLTIESPPGTTSVRGTSFRVGLQDEAVRLGAETLEGAVAVAGAGRRVDVPAGFGTTATRGAPPR